MVSTSSLKKLQKTEKCPFQTHIILVWSFRKLENHYQTKIWFKKLWTLCLTFPGNGFNLVNLFKYIGKIIENADVYVGKSVTVFVRLPNTRQKSYLKILINASTEVLKISKHCAILRLATKEKQLLSNLTKLFRRSSMI